MEPMLSIACSRWLCSSLVSPVSLPESTIYPGVGNGLRAFGLKLHIAKVAPDCSRLYPGVDPLVREGFLAVNGPTKSASPSGGAGGTPTTRVGALVEEPAVVPQPSPAD